MFSDLVELFRLVVFVLLKGGWVVLVAALIYMFWKLYIDYIQIRYYNQQEWVYLSISAPRESEKSPLAFEQIFNQLHAIHSTYQPAERYIEGKIHIWFTWEMVGIGGTISNFVKILTKHRDTLEAAIYSQFPEAEITETDDYFDRLPRYHTDTSDFDIFAFSFKLANPDPYPIRSYLDFEHPTADTFVDPVTGIWEELGKLNPYEMFVVQYLIRPWDDKWKVKGYELVQKLKGVPEANRKPAGIGGIIGKVFGPFLDILIRPEPTMARPKKEEPPSLMLHLSEGEKIIIAAIERKLSKLSFKVKIRCLYLAPREKYNPSPVYTAVIGAFKSWRATNLNALKPDTDHWTKPHYWVDKDWEKSIHELRNKYRKRRFWSQIRRRFIIHGRKHMMLNSEELATILHFPTIEVTVPRIEKVTVTKIQPPPELPVAP